MALQTCSMSSTAWTVGMSGAAAVMDSFVTDWFLYQPTALRMKVRTASVSLGRTSQRVGSSIRASMAG